MRNWRIITAFAVGSIAGCGGAPQGDDGGADGGGAGCTKDTDCKGDRICVQGACVSPGGEGGSPADMSMQAMADMTMAGMGDIAMSPTCNDKMKDGDETDLDCGGSCQKCADGKICQGAADCQSAACLNNSCVPAAGGMVIPVFGAADPYGANMEPFGVSAADFNGDNKIDLVVANRSSSDVSILLGKGDGTFGTPTNFSVGNGQMPYAVFALDMNNDKHADVLVAQGTNQMTFTSVSLLVGKGDGTLMAVQNYPSQGSGTPVLPCLGDFNGDGRIDVAVAVDTWVSIYTMLNNGALTPKSQTPYANNSFLGCATGDFDGDAKVDIIASDPNGARVVFLAGNGDATFSAPAAGGSLAVLLNGTLTAGDWNGDKKADYASLRNTVGVGLGKGNGAFQGSVGYAGASGSGWRFITSADMNRDGKVDLLSSGRDAPSVSILLGDGTGVFPVSTSHLAGISVPQFAVADFNGDGRPDLAVADSTVVNVLLNKTP